MKKYQWIVIAIVILLGGRLTVADGIQTDQQVAFTPPAPLDFQLLMWNTSGEKNDLGKVELSRNGDPGNPANRTWYIIPTSTSGDYCIASGADGKVLTTHASSVFINPSLTLTNYEGTPVTVSTWKNEDDQIFNIKTLPSQNVLLVGKASKRSIGGPASWVVDNHVLNLWTIENPPNISQQWVIHKEDHHVDCPLFDAPNALSYQFGSNFARDNGAVIDMKVHFRASSYKKWITIKKYSGGDVKDYKKFDSDGEGDEDSTFSYTVFASNAEKLRIDCGRYIDDKHTANLPFIRTIDHTQNPVGLVHDSYECYYGAITIAITMTYNNPYSKVTNPFQIVNADSFN